MSAAQVRSLEYGGFTIRAGLQCGKPRANVFRTVLKSLRHHVEAAQIDAAVKAARAWIDGWHVEKQRGRTVVDGRTIGSQADFRDALEVVPISEPQRLMLQAHCRAPDHTLSATELAKAAGYRNHAAANSLYGRLGKAIADAAGLPGAPAERRDNAVVWTGVLAWGSGEPSRTATIAGACTTRFTRRCAP